MHRQIMNRFVSAALLVILLTGCGAFAPGVSMNHNPNPQSRSTPTAAGISAPAPSPTTSIPTVAAETTPAQDLTIWVSPGVPEGLQIRYPKNIRVVSQKQDAALRLEAAHEPNPNAIASTEWIYAIVAPFPTVEDEVDGGDLRAAWQGKLKKTFPNGPLLVSADTWAVLQAWWGPAGTDTVRVVPEAELLETAWGLPALAVIPFENLEPRWKVLRVDGQSPLDKDFNPQQYPLAVRFKVTGTENAQSRQIELPTNRDPDLLTTVVLTGVTALSRHTAETMQREGITYPGRDIREWLTTADVTHISNEVSFFSDCPAPGPERRDMRFCSNPDYIELLEYVGTDIVELTGNHLLDWGTEPLLESLEIYRQRGLAVYGGGANLEEALQPLFVEHNGNRLVFIGCSPAGPANVWATAEKPGSAPCDMPTLEQNLQRLSSEGYLPIVTLQAIETDWYEPTVAQSMPDFRRLARAGAVIVSGSQSHYPQTMTFVGDHFVHYGLGNLFFDQMDLLATRQEFIDRHVFYNGRYLGVELLSALLEDYARPRPMTPDERAEFLTKIFSLSNWVGE